MARIGAAPGWWAFLAAAVYDWYYSKKTIPCAQCGRRFEVEAGGAPLFFCSIPCSLSDAPAS